MFLLFFGLLWSEVCFMDTFLLISMSLGVFNGLLPFYIDIFMII